MGVTYYVILIVKGMMVAAAAAQQLLQQLPRRPQQLRPLTWAGQRRTTNMTMRGRGGGMMPPSLPPWRGRGGGEMIERTPPCTTVPVTDPPGNDNDNSGGSDDNNHDHYYVQFLRIFQRSVVHRRHQRRVDCVGAHNEVT